MNQPITPKQQEWRETILKGRMAESLVLELFKESGNEVYRIGYESVLPRLLRIKDSFNRDSNVAEKVRAIPDLFVIDKSGNPHLVEIKFRFDAQWHDYDQKILDRLRTGWQEAIIAVVSRQQKPYFRYSKYPFDKIEPIQNLEFFNITQELLNKFDVLVDKYLAPAVQNNALLE